MNIFVCTVGIACVSNSMKLYELKKREIVFVRKSFIILTPPVFLMKCQVHQLAIDAINISELFCVCTRKHWLSKT